MMSIETKNRPRWKLGIAITLALWAAIFAAQKITLSIHDSNRLKHSNSEDKVVKPQVQNQMPAEEQTKPISLPADPIKNQVIDKKRSATEIAVVNDWLKSVGYDNSNLEIYRGYSEEQLKNLSNSGDVNAMHILAEKRLNEDDREAAKGYLNKAIAYGSLRAIATMSHLSGLAYGINTPLADAKFQLKESFAYDELIKKRGDKFTASALRNADLKFFEKTYGKENSITTEDENWIRSRADELYNQYKSERTKFGLSEFNDQPPQEVIDFLEK